MIFDFGFAILLFVFISFRLFGVVFVLCTTYVIFNAAIRMTAKSESLQSSRPDNKHMNVWELYILDTIDWNVEAKNSLLLWETISMLNEILALAFQFWQPDSSHDIQSFKEDLLEVASQM